MLHNHSAREFQMRERKLDYCTCIESTKLLSAYTEWALCIDVISESSVPNPSSERQRQDSTIVAVTRQTYWTSNISYGKALCRREDLNRQPAR
jgi:hypothetical protein